MRDLPCRCEQAPWIRADLICSLFHSIFSHYWHSLLLKFYTLSSTSEDSDTAPFFWDLLGAERRSLPPGLEEALPYHIIPMIAMNIPNTTWWLRPSFPKNMNPKIKTRIVFIWPRTWNDTAVNLPMHMNWLRLVPTAMVQDRRINDCREQNQRESIMVATSHR